MRARSYIALFLFSTVFLWGVPAHAEVVTLYSQLDNSGEMLSQQATFQNTWIASESLGNLVLGKDRLTITFTMKDPNANILYHSPFGGVTLETCSGCQNLQKYFFTDADRILLSDGAFHTFTVETGTTTLGIADGETPIYINFFGLSQYHLGTHLKSNAAGTIPYLRIEGTPPPPPIIPQAPPGSTVVYTQSDKTGIMTNPQRTSLSSYIDSASLGNLPLGQGKLYVTFTMKDPNASNLYGMPQGICIQPAGSIDCSSRLQSYYFTAADRALLADQAFHTFMVETGTTTSMYADGTRPVSIGFFGLSQYQYGTKIKSDAAGTIPYLTIQTAAPPPDPCAAAGNCVSNVLFLPGIEASRLYRPDGHGGDKKLWEPGPLDTLQDLYLTPEGKSVRTDVYAKTGDVVDETPVTGANIYKSFIAKMNDLRDKQHLINAWEADPYDWRLSIDDILTHGKQIGTNISYLDATSTPYIMQELKHLAATSKTGKVTIVAHSNGGLVAKQLTKSLGPEASALIDKLIFVAVPQVGTPAAVAADMHGYDQALAGGLVVSQSTARTFASSSPMAYNLLPSAQYFTHVDNPVISFDTSLPDWITRYGAAIHSQELLHSFLTGSYGRADAQTGDINQPIQASDTLLLSAEALHADLDTWTPPTGVPLIQIAGWGVPTTVAGITYKKKGVGVIPEANFTVDGDGTVVVPSALWTSTTTGAVNYWVDLKSYNTLANRILGLRLKADHASILEVPELLTFIIDNLLARSSNSLPQYISSLIPSTDSHDLRLRYALHSPLTLNIYDDQGRHTGVSTSTGQVEEQIPGTYYTEFGDVKYLFSDASTSAHVVMDGYATGTFTFNIDQYSGNTLTASTTFKDIPTTASTVVAMDVQSDISTLSPMTIDKNGDGTIDAVLAPKLNDTVIFDTTPPELQITFSTTTKSISFIGTDDMSTAAIATSISYPVLKKGQKEYKGVATTTVIARDEAGNTTALVYTEQFPSPKERDLIVLRELAYNGATTTLSSVTLSYKWRISKNGSFNTFASNLRTASTTLESHYRPKKDTTIIMTRPQDLDDSDADDDSDARAAKQMLPGMVVPYMMTKKGSAIINY